MNLRSMQEKDSSRTAADMQAPVLHSSIQRALPLYQAALAAYQSVGLAALLQHVVDHEDLPVCG